MLSSFLAGFALQAACAAALPSASGYAAAPMAARAFCSSSDLKYKLDPVPGPVRGAGAPASNASTWRLTVDDTAAGEKQQVTGFGAAVTDATVSVLDALPADKRAEVLRLLLTADGADFGLMRHTIGASDLSAPPAYTYDDNGGREDLDLAGFALGARGEAMAALLADMRALKPELTLLGSPWAPPAWMQLDRRLTGGTVDNNLDHNYTRQFGDYFVKYLQAYAARGAPVDAITIQNEPLNSQPDMPTMYIYADESGALIRDSVGPALRAAGLATQVWAYDHNTGTGTAPGLDACFGAELTSSPDEPSYPQTVLDTASEYVDAVAWHVSPRPPVSRLVSRPPAPGSSSNAAGTQCYASDTQWSVLSDFHAQNPGVAQYMTECWTSSQSTPWHAASSFALGPLQNWAAGALAWTLGSDTADGPHLAGGCDTCRGLVVVDAAAGTYELTVDYYMLAQYSRAFARGARVLAGTGSYTYDGGAGLQSVAARNPDGARAVVIENTFGNDVYVTLDTASGETWSGNVLAASVVTWILP